MVQWDFYFVRFLSWQWFLLEVFSQLFSVLLLSTFNWFIVFVPFLPRLFLLVYIELGMPWRCFGKIVPWSLRSLEWIFIWCKFLHFTVVDYDSCNVLSQKDLRWNIRMGAGIRARNIRRLKLNSHKLQKHQPNINLSNLEIKHNPSRSFFFGLRHAIENPL